MQKFVVLPAPKTYEKLKNCLIQFQASQNRFTTDKSWSVDYFLALSKKNGAKNPEEKIDALASQLAEVHLLTRKGVKDQVCLEAHLR